MPRGKDISIVPGEYYHLYTRGVGKKNIFLDDRDFARFLFGILHFQYAEDFHNISDDITRFLNTGTFASPRKKLPQESARMTELVAFTLMPNHIHLIVQELKEGGIAMLMQRSLGGYAKYFNAKYTSSGHLFQGAYNAVHIEDNEQILYVSAYVHRNPRELPGWKGRESKYPWSSFPDYISSNRWGVLIKPEIILEQFSKNEPYRTFVEKSPAKATDQEMGGAEL